MNFGDCSVQMRCPILCSIQNESFLCQQTLWTSRVVAKMQEELPNSGQLDRCLVCLSQLDKQPEWDLISLFTTQESQAAVDTWQPELHACPAGIMVPHQESPDTDPTRDGRSEGATQQQHKRNAKHPIPHKIIERQHRARFNTQLDYLKETLREELSAFSRICGVPRIRNPQRPRS